MHFTSLRLLRRSLRLAAGVGLCLCLATCFGGDEDVPVNWGLSLISGDFDGAGSLDGTGTDAHFNGTEGIAADASGNLYVADTYNNTIRKITPAGVVTTLAGTGGSFGSADGTGAAARFDNPSGITADGSGNLYVADTYNNMIRKIVIATGVVTTVAGTSTSFGGADGTGAAAEFYYPRGITTDGAGNLYVADTNNHTIRKIVIATGVVTTLAGSPGSHGSYNGTGAGAWFVQPHSITIDGLGDLYVADTRNHTIRKIVIATAVVSTPFGTANVAGVADGTGVAARFTEPGGITADGFGNLYVADTDNHTIRRIVIATGVVTTLAGTAGSSGSADGAGAAARFNSPHGIVADFSGNVYVADRGNYMIRKVTAGGGVSSVAGTASKYGSADGAGAAAGFSSPNGVAMDASGDLYVADTNNQTIRKVTASGVVTTLAGTAGSTGDADGTGAAARFGQPIGIAADASGMLYVTDWLNSTIRKIVIATGVVTTFAGTAGNVGDADGTGAAARFNKANGIAADTSGNLYVADTYNHTIRKIVIATGVVTTLAGTAGSGGDTDGTGAAALFNGPSGIAADASGNLYVADTNNHTIRKIVSATGVVTTLAGTAGVFGSADGTGGAARFKYPYSVAVDAAGNVYVADMDNHTIRKIVPTTGTVTTVAGVAGQYGVRLGDLPGGLSYPSGVTSMAPNTLAVTTGNGVVRIVSP